MSAPQPVFVDASGQRRRLLRALGAVAGALLLLYLVLIGIGMATGSGVPLTPWSAPNADRPHVPAGADGNVTLLPKGGPSAGGGRVSGPSAGPGLPGLRNAPGAPAASGRPAGQPGGGTATSPAAGPTAPAPAPTTASPATTSPSNTHSPPAWGRNKKNP